MIQQKPNRKKNYIAPIASYISTKCKSPPKGCIKNHTAKAKLLPIMYYSQFLKNNLNNSPNLNISTFRKRTLSQPKLFSLLDINDKITNKRSTDLPIQYRRRSPEEIKQLLYYKPHLKQIFKHTNNYENQGDINNKELNNSNNNTLQKQNYSPNNSYLNNLSRNVLDNSFNSNDNNVEEIQVKGNLSCNQNDISIPLGDQNVIDYLSQSDRSTLVFSRNKLLYKPYILDNYNDFQKSQKEKTDKFKPKHFDFCEHLIKKATITNKFKKIPKHNIDYSYRSKSVHETKDLDKLKEINKTTLLHNKDSNPNNMSSYIQKEPQMPQISSYKTKKFLISGSNTQKYRQSDIFFLKNDENSKNKSGEKTLFKIIPPFKYTTSRESNSMWNPKNRMPSLLNHSSSEAHLLNPSIQNISQTKKQIDEKYKEMNISQNVANKKKGFSEFIDLSRVSAPHLNYDYLSIYNKDQNTFAKRNNVCSDFNDMYKLGYLNLCDKPFKKFQEI